jgi:uncharacterized membrane protein YecN with MAPEG domain
MNDSFAAVGLYVGLNALILLVLAYNVGSRRGAQNALDPGATGDAVLTRAIRAHANFAEYAPVALIILVALALTDTGALPIHIIGAAFTIGRVLHAFGMMRKTHPNAVRFAGNLITGLVLLGGGALCLLRFYEALAP